MSSASNGVRIIYGAGGLSPNIVKGLTVDEDELHVYSGKILDILEKEGIANLDAAELYARSEAEIGFHRGAERFIVDTKIPSGLGPPRTKDENFEAAKACLERLKTKQIGVLVYYAHAEANCQVNIPYFHGADTRMPWEDQLSAINPLYEQGAFKQLGVSNFSAEQVQELYDVAKKNGYPLPTVYQGSYSAVSRLSETRLLPTLRRLGIAYYAYSPIAGGFLAKTRKQIEEGAGRFDPETILGQMYLGLYSKPAHFDALDTWDKSPTRQTSPRQSWRTDGLHTTPS
jgi:aflatoxin B1 aldehyde reductase